MLDVFLCINCVMVDVFCNDMSQVAIKIIDKTQLNPGSLQKVCLGLPLSCTTVFLTFYVCVPYLFLMFVLRIVFTFNIILSFSYLEKFG